MFVTMKGMDIMWKYTVDVEGMMCGMCESHANDCCRRSFNVKKVSSSHARNQTVIITEDELTLDDVRKAFEGTGYEVHDLKKETAKKGLFGWKD